MINKVILVGNLGKDPELQKVNDTEVCKFSIATSESYKNKQGEKQTQTEWHNVELWGGLAKLSQYLSKGSTIYLEGKITTQSWENEDGQKVYKTVIRANKVQMLSRKEEVKPQQTTPSATPVNFTPQTSDNDVLPF